MSTAQLGQSLRIADHRDLGDEQPVATKVPEGQGHWV
jgi:hypothetical protein